MSKRLIGFSTGAAALLFLASCSTTDSQFNNGADDGGVDESSDDVNFVLPGPGDAAVGLIVTPPSAVLSATGTPVTQQYQAVTSDTMAAVTPQWSLDNVALGNIDANGLFTAVGTVGGTATIGATFQNAVGSATVTVNVALTENPGGVSASDQAKLIAGGTDDPGFGWLYPYDNTILLRGLQPAVMQFAGTAPSAMYVHMKSKYLDYSGFFGASNPGQVTLSPAMWNQIMQSVAASDPLSVTVTKMTGGNVSKPATRTWGVAQASAHGTVYYNTYSNGGEMFSLKVGTNAVSLFGSANCQVCHSASASGNVLASTGGTYDLTKPMAPALINSGNREYSFAAVYPDGSFLLTTYVTSPGGAGTSPAQLRNSKTGVQIAAPGLDGTSINPSMPAFSPDGKKIVFNSGNSQTLSVMNFDPKTHTFSSKVDIYTSSLWPAWPQFTPDGAYVLFHDDSLQEFGTRSGALANIKMIEVATKKVTSLDTLNGMKGSTPYMPYGSAEIDMNYEPTILPLAVGGYYWVVFTSRRCYGNILTPTTDPDPFAYGTARRKKLWVAALDINPKSGTDPSHPAFYLPGQDLTPGNMRAFWSLDPCKADGKTCASADECCGGYCRQVGTQKVCVPPPGGCSHEYEVCTTAADCCDTGDLCIAGHCAVPTPQ